MQDYQIVELYWARDELAIRESNARYGSYCRRIAGNILSSLEDSEECVNDTWLRAWDCMPPEKPGALSAFFGRIVRNLALDRYRREHAVKRYAGITELLSELEDCVPSRQSTEEAIESKRLAEVISGWLTALPADDRALFIRRYWFGDAVQALARECGASQSQMAQRMLRLRKKLKAKLVQEDFAL